MDSVVRAAAVYLTLLLLFRIIGKRSLAETGAFDFVLLLIIAEATQQAMIDDDNSMMNAFLIIVTLLALNVGFSLLKQRSPLADQLIDDVPVLIVVDGNPLKDRMDQARVDERDILQAARESQGLARLDEIKYAVLERNGTISVIPNQSA
jgi:uncharacterized membrane protein YcaP (DUF421 family)